MKRSNYTEEQIVQILQEAESCQTTQAGVCRKHGVSMNTFYVWKRKYSGMEQRDVRHGRELEDENTRLKRSVANLALEIDARKKWVLPIVGIGLMAIIVSVQYIRMSESSNWDVAYSAFDQIPRFEDLGHSGNIERAYRVCTSFLGLSDVQLNSIYQAKIAEAYRKPDAPDVVSRAITLNRVLFNVTDRRDLFPLTGGTEITGVAARSELFISRGSLIEEVKRYRRYGYRPSLARRRRFLGFWML